MRFLSYGLRSARAMKHLSLLGVLLTSGLPMAAQSCPSINFSTASQVTMTGNTMASGLQRLSNGSFTLHSYTGNGTVAGVQQLVPTSGYQSTFLNCTGHSPKSVTPPSGWSFLGDPLLGTMLHDPWAGDLLGAGTTVGFCLAVCNPVSTVLQMAVATASGNIASAPTYTVGEFGYGFIIADLNNDGLGDVIVLNSDTPATLSVYLMQANGTLGSPTSVPVSAGGNLSGTFADFNGDGNIDLAVTTDHTSTITILLGKGNGTFQTPIVVNTISSPEFIAAGHLKSASILDIVVSNSNEIGVHFGNGNGTFGSAQTIFTPGYLAEVAVADVNHDGLGDIVAVDSDGDVALVLLNAGGGTFPTITGTVAGTDTSQMFLMDFDWDGNPDIVFGAGHPDALMPSAYTTSVTVIFGNGNGTFNGIPAYPIDTTRAQYPVGIAVAEFTGDEIPDAVAASTSGLVTLLTGVGNGTFTSQTLPFQANNSLAAGQFTRDGHIDLVTTSETGIAVYLGNGNGTFQTPAAASIAVTSSGITGAAVGDFNRDGNLDFVVVDSAGGTSANAYVYLGNGNGTFQSPKTFVVGSSPQQVQVADVNGDDIPDLVVTNQGTYGSASDVGSVAVLIGNGDGTFAQPVQYPAGTNPVFTLVTDLNGDGLPDLATTTTLDATNFVVGLSLRFNQGKGVFSGARGLPSEFGPTQIGAADFNGDGYVDLVVSHCCGDTQLGYFMGTGQGNFQPEVSLTSGQSQDHVVVADLNGDGKPDVMFSMYGPYVAAMLNISVATTPINIQTSPEGRQFTVDGGTPQTAPQVVNLSQGTHTIAVATPQAGVTGIQYAFSSWSDGGAISHSISVGSSTATYTATFQTQYQLTIAASPTAGGTVTPPSGTFYNATTAVPITATPISGYNFNGWSGAVANASSASTTVTMSAAENVTANFLAVAPPAAAVLTTPGNGSTMISAVTSIDWLSSAGATSYDVYFGTSSTPPFVTNTTATSYSPGILVGGTTYFWKVVAKNTAGSSPSPIWSFKTATSPSKVGIFRQGFFWLLDTDGNRQWDDPPDQAFAYGGIAGDIPITGDWTGDGHTKVGIYRAKNGDFILDSNGDEVFDAGDAVYKFLQNVGGPLPTDVPVVGDWNGSGTTKIGIVRDGFLWLLDLNGDGIYEPGTDLEYVFGGAPGDIPVVGDWTGTGTTKIGVLRDGFLWLLDANGNGTWDGTAGGDYAFAFGAPGDVPVVGDWTGDGVTKVGMFRLGFFWVLDSDDPAVTNATGVAPLIAFPFGGIAGDVPIVGKWFAPPATITTTGGTPQSTSINSAFAAPLALQVIGDDGYPVSGATMFFTVPGSGASATFAGGVNTSVTNGAGVATSAIPSANGTVGGPYSVMATVQSCGTYPGCPGSAAAANFSLTNTTAAPAVSSPQQARSK
jgi:hypothetical protein